MIGEQFNLRIVATYTPANYHLHWLNFPDSIAHFEVVDKSKPDTVSDKGITTVQQTITFTSFDSGRWFTPSLPINFDPVVDDTTLNIYIDSLPINVTYSPPDSTNQLRDIKPIMEVTVQDYFWYYVAGGVLLLLLIVYLLFRYFTIRKKKPAAEFDSKLSPYDEAMQSLHKLTTLNLQDAGDVKQYHSSLSTIFKRYISRRQDKNLMNKTTYDVLIHLSENGFSKENVASIASSLRTGDAVKFAKYLPSSIESEGCFNTIKDAISFIESIKQTNN